MLFGGLSNFFNNRAVAHIDRLHLRQRAEPLSKHVAEYLIGDHVRKPLLR